MTDIWINRLSEYVDRELDPADEGALEAHLAECQRCRATVEELRGVVARARGLEDRPPLNDLWSGIAGRIAGKRVPAAVVDLGTARRRRIAFSVPQLLAAGIALMAVSGGAVWLAIRAPVATQTPVAVEGVAPNAMTARPVLAADEYDSAIAELEHVLREHRDQLDPETVATLTESVAAIDRAIEEAQAALVSDPANAYLNNHLADTMRRKIHVLSRAAALVRTAS